MYEVANGNCCQAKVRKSSSQRQTTGSWKASLGKSAMSKGLMSVTQMCQHGNRVVFDDDGSFIHNEKLERSHGSEKPKALANLPSGLALQKCR